MFSSQNSQVSSATNYIEDVFSTYLYTGNGSTQTITNGIDLSGKGGLVWFKARNIVSNHGLYDTARGATNSVISNSTNGQSSVPNGLTAFNTNGFSTGNNATVNGSGNTFASWTFRKQPKFFDVVTGTGSGTFNHNLQSVPGCIILKRTDGASSWFVKHNGLTGGITGTYDVTLNTTAAQSDSGVSFNPTSTQFTVAGYISAGETWVAYLFAHDAGGFGLTGTDNVISCGSFTTNGSGQATVNLGYEPQWVLFKPSSTTGEWTLLDTMRGWVADGTNADKLLYANKSDAEVGAYNMGITATGFDTRANLGASQTHIYIAIRRGPMKVPTSGTSVFSPVARTGTSATATVTGVGFPPDLFIVKGRSTGTEGATRDRLRGTNPALRTSTSNAESSTTTNGLLSYDMDGVTLGADNTGTDVNGQTNASPSTYANWFFRRAPSFFDEVCYTGTGVTHTETHNLGVAPELIIVKRRASVTASWAVYAAPLTASYVGFLDLTNAFQADNMWNSTAPTSTAFTVRAANAQVNASGSTYVAYLFATCAGVSKVGSYTGTGASGNAITTGFSPRFLMIKCTSTTGNWIVFDTARGMGAGSDPYLLLNTTGAEVTGTDWLDVSSSGFSLNTTGNATNGSGQTYIYLAIA